MAELERALLRAGLFTVDVSHHQHHHSQEQQQQQPVDTAKSRMALGRRRKALSPKPAIPENNKLSNRVCILEIEHANLKQHDTIQKMKRKRYGSVEGRVTAAKTVIAIQLKSNYNAIL